MDQAVIGDLRTAMLALTLVVSGCTNTELGGDGGSGRSHSIEYRVTGSAPAVNGITYQNANGDTSQVGRQELPWSLSLTLRSGAFAYVSAQNDGETGTVVCTILVDGVEAEANSSEGAYTICTASGTV